MDTKDLRRFLCHDGHGLVRMLFEGKIENVRLLFSIKPGDYVETAFFTVAVEPIKLPICQMLKNLVHELHGGKGTQETDAERGYGSETWIQLSERSKKQKRTLPSEADSENKTEGFEGRVIVLRKNG